VDAAIEREMPGTKALLDECDARLVPEAKARSLGLLGPDETYVPDLDELRRELLATLKVIGKIQTGQPVDTRWCLHAAEMLAYYKLGVAGFKLAEETHAKAIQAVIEAAKVQLAADLKKGSPADPDIPF
jgi:hypothetical protein